MPSLDFIWALAPSAVPLHPIKHPRAFCTVVAKLPGSENVGTFQAPGGNSSCTLRGESLLLPPPPSSMASDK